MEEFVQMTEKIVATLLNKLNSGAGIIKTYSSHIEIVLRAF